MAKKKTSLPQQPRALTTDLAVQPYFRGSMYAELQKFQIRDREKAWQLTLGETEEDLLETDGKVQAYGLDLTVSEDRALHAVQILLDQTGYQGNISGETVSSNAFKWEGLIPRLFLTYGEYLEAYGLARGSRGQLYEGRQAQEAIEALRSLAETRRICYERRRWIGKGKARKQVTDIIRVTRPLISIMEGFEGLDENEAAQVIAGQDLPEKKSTRLVIEVSPLLVDQIDTFYLLKPKALHTEIKELLGGKRISRAVSLFIEWLLTKNTRTVKISKSRLAERLRMDYLIEQRHQERLEARLQEAFHTAKDLEYLLAFREEPTGLLIFELNPARCRRIEGSDPDKAEEEV